jgi:hypothetical protein
MAQQNNDELETRVNYWITQKHYTMEDGKITEHLNEGIDSRLERQQDELVTTLQSELMRWQEKRQSRDNFYSHYSGRITLSDAFITTQYI